MFRVKNKTKPIKNGVKIPKYIIYTGKLLQWLNLNLATKYAVFLFKFPIKFQTPQRELMMSKSSQNQFVYIPSINKKIYVYKYGYSTRKVLLVHGWSGRGTQLYYLADKLLEHGFMTYSFDAPAHGKSEGKTTMMPDFIEVIKELEKKFGPFEIAIGHSLGGMAVLNAIKTGLQVKKAISISAGDIITDIVKNFVKQMELNPKIAKRMEEFYFKRFNEDINSYSASVAAQDVTIPVLVIHDSSDTDVAVSCAHNIRQNLKQGLLLITQNLGHRRILKDRFVSNEIIKFINNDEV